MGSNFKPGYRELDASKLKIRLKKDFGGETNAPEITRKTCTDHMVVVDWTHEGGWNDPEIVPHEPFAMHPSSSVLHYANIIYEGQKLYRGYDGKLRLFRPDQNAERMLSSSARMLLPSFPPAELKNLVKKLCGIDGPKWLSRDRQGSCMYIRPTLIATDTGLGFDIPREAKLFVIISCFIPIPEICDNGLRLITSQMTEVRSWPGGTGNFKVGANYGPTLRALGDARRAGYDLTLWLFGPERKVTESGSSNFFVIWRTASGGLQLVTCPLADGLILPGITRKSVLELARERLNVKALAGQDVEALEVYECDYTMSDLVKAQDEGRLVAAFAVGTAYFVTPVGHVHWEGCGIDFPSAKSVHIPIFQKYLEDIMYGNVESDWAEVIEEHGV